MGDPEEKRGHKRLGVTYQYFMTAEGRTRSGMSRDVSPFGIGVYSDDFLDPGTACDIRVFIAEFNFKIEARGEVVYCHENPEAPPKYVLGIRFTEGPLEDLANKEPKKHLSRHTPSHSISINASARRCYDLLGAFTRYPEWASGIEAATVIETYPDGRGRRVDFLHNFFFRKVHYILDYVYNDENTVLSWISSGGDDDILTITGSYNFKPKANNLTLATYELYINLSIIPSRQLVQYVTNILMLKEMKNFKAFVEKNVG